MANVTIKDIPDELYEKIKSSAKANRRSVSSEVIGCLEQFFEPSSAKDPSKLVEEFRRFRESMPNLRVTEEWLRSAKDEGRE